MEEEILVEGLEDNEPFVLTMGDTQDVYDEEEPVEEVVEEVIIKEE